MRGRSERRRVTPRGIAALGAMLGALGWILLVTPAEAVVGVEGTMDYAIDAPWRIEPSAFRDGSPVYGAIPIQITIHDANLLDRDRNHLPDGESIQVGRVCSIVVRERRPADAIGAPPTGASRVFPFAALDEVEFTRGSWPAPGDPGDKVPAHSLCKAWAGEDCSGDDLVAGSSEWHASLSYVPTALTPGTSLSLQVEVQLTKDPGSDCGAAGGGVIRLINEVFVFVSDASLPRFGASWLYGDLHYHSQGTDNEGESGYNYRGVLRAMGAMGMDFAFATEHASNSTQIVDIDANFGDIPIEFPPREHPGGLRDMSDDRFRFLHQVLNGSGGANSEAGLITSAGDAEPAARVRAMPQIFLGGEVDLIPEMAPGSSYGDVVPWGNHQVWSTENLCVGRLFSIGPIDIDCEFLGIDLLEKTATDPDAVLVDDIQAFTVDFGRHHIVYLPRRAADRDAFVRSDTGRYGGAHRRFVEMKPEIEAHGTFFAAHSISHFERGDGFLTDPGPTDIPWTDHLHDQVWRSPAFLGLQFWNEDARLRENVPEWSATTVMDPFPSAGFCATIPGGPFFPTKYICPVAGGDVGYERYDSHIIGIPYAYLPVENAQSGFGSGLFHLDVSAPVSGRFEEPFNTVEEKLHHGAFTWDRLNHWGLDVHKTRELAWLPSFLAPRRLFMAGGSDAHGDLNYRRTGYVIRTETINDAALGKPRNLVNAGAPGGATLSRGPARDPVAVHSQDQISAAIEQGRFSITDGPALRIVADLDRDGVVDPDEPAMGDTMEVDASLILPLLVEWKSTTEFGAVQQVDLYVGVRSSEVDLPASAHLTGRTYAPRLAGVFHHTIPGQFPLPIPDFFVEDPPFNRMNDFYWEDPTGQLRFFPENGLEGTRSVVLDLNRFPAMHDRRGDRFFVRAFAVTGTSDAFCAPPVHTSGCLRRYAFTNPIWAVEKSFLCSAEAGLDGTAPEVACNAPETLLRGQLPLSFTATAEDLCGAEVVVHDLQCYAVHADGTRTQRRCVVRTDDDTTTMAIDRADGTGTIVSWEATATDPAGNSTTTHCQVEALNSDPSGSSGP